MHRILPTCNHWTRQSKLWQQYCDILYCKEVMMEEFVLSRELRGHEDGVRAVSCAGSSIVSGAQDTMAICWSELEGSGYTNIGASYDASNWITAVLGLPDGGYVTGSRDCGIRVYSAPGLPPSLELRGHEAGITSLSLSPSGHLLSGSWDGTARVWSLADGSCLQVLPGHENGVSVIGLPGGDIITASTGKQVGPDTIVDFQVRIWRDGREVASLREHNGAVRCLAPVPGLGFVSCSNDGSLILWSAAGVPLQVLAAPVDGEHAGFILSCAVLPTGEFISGGEDCTLRIWRDGALVQTIVHPNTVWSVAVLPNGDVVTGCGDKVVRIFTRESSRIASDAEMESFSAAVTATATAASEAAAVDVSTLVAYERRKPASDGKVTMFRKDGKAFAFKFDASCGDWIEIGEVVSGTGKGPRRQELHGIEYDRVIGVDIETSLGLQNLKLGFNLDESPYEAAQRFITANPEVQQAHLDQIARYIRQQKGVSAPTLGMGAAPAPPPFSSEHFPVKAAALFDVAKNLAGLVNKFNEFISAVHAGDDAKVTVKAEAVKEVVAVLEDTSHYHTTTFTTRHYAMVESCLAFPVDKVFPVLDLVRLMLVHPAAQEHYRGVHGEALADSLISKLKVPGVKSPVPMLAFRALCNLCKGTAANAFNDAVRCEALLRTMSFYSSGDANVQQANATLLMNLCIAKSNGVITVAHDISLLQTLKQLLSAVTDDLAKYRLLAALGTLALRPDAQEAARSLGLDIVASSASFAATDDVIVKDLITLFSSRSHK